MKFELLRKIDSIAKNDTMENLTQEEVKIIHNELGFLYNQLSTLTSQDREPDPKIKLGEWIPKNKLQEEIYNFWRVRGHTDIEGALGKYLIKFKNPRTGNELDLQYLEQFVAAFKQR